MNEFPLFYMIVLFITAVCGGALIMLRVKQSDSGLRLLLAFSAAYLLGLAILHLLPELFHSPIKSAGWYVIAGFLLQIVLDFFSHGVEHGHAHVQHHDGHHHHGTKFLVLVMVSLWIHAFIEGMPFGGGFAHVHDHSHAHDHHAGAEVAVDHRDSLLIGIGLHKFTEAFVFVSLLVASGFSKWKSFSWLLLFALMAPAGAAVQFLLGSNNVVDLASFTPMVMGVLVGIILHVSTTIIFESSEGHHFNLKKFVAILLGIAASVLAGSH